MWNLLRNITNHCQNSKAQSFIPKKITLSETFKIFSCFSLFSRMDADNPWQVESIEAFYFLKCPECNFFTKEDKTFYNHAVENHSLSFVLFGKPAKSKELLAQKGILNEDVNFQLYTVIQIENNATEIIEDLR